MIDIPTAISRLRNRDEYLVGKIAEREASGQSAYWQGQDREAIELAISALDYLQQVQDYEASQTA